MDAQQEQEYIKLPETQKRAKLLGEKFYFTGIPCRRTHISPRYTSSGNCTQCISEYRGIALENRHGLSAVRHEEDLQSIAEGAEQGHSTYTSKYPCKKGHTERWISSNNCIKCDEAAQKARKHRTKWSRMKKIYGLEESQYKQMMSDQKNQCSICTLTLEVGHTHIDHCHKQGKVRSLLCSKCNQAIGLLDEDIDRIYAAADYLNRHTP